MGRTRSFLSLGIVSSLVLGFIIPSAALAGGNCQNKFVEVDGVPPGFTCTVKFSNGSSMTECWTFAQGTLSKYFDIFTENTETDLDHYGCACGTTGSFKSPKFNSSSNTFECDDGNGGRLNGTIKGKKLSGQSSNEDGSSEIFSCTRNTGCG
jgi:hypothetical protein